MNDDSYMRKAIEEAYAGINQFSGGPFGAVIVKGDRILASAHNTVLKENDPTKHAEMNTISDASKILGSYDLSGCVIYSTTEPCPMCFSAIHWARIGRVVYGTEIGDVEKLGFNELIIPVEKMKEISDSGIEFYPGFMLKECMELLQYWKALPDRSTY